MKIKLLYVFLFALVFRLALAPLASHPDLGNHVDWGIRFYEYGVDKFYAPESNVWNFTWPNQPPGTIMIFAGIRKIYEFIFNVFWQINTSVPVFPSLVIGLIDKYLYIVMLKLPAILSDLGIAYLIYKFLHKFKYEKVAKFGAVLFLLNPVIWYNSSVWGQTDSTINFFALLGLWLVFQRKPIFSALAFAVSLYIKVSLAVFIPIFVVLFLKQKFTLKQIAASIVLPIILVSVVTIPFSYPNEPSSWLFKLYQDKVLANQLQVITANAFNLWVFLTGIVEKPHDIFFGPIPFKIWGALLFTFSFMPLLYKLWRKPDFDNTVWVLCLTAFSSFMLLTNMHERYLYPLFPYFTILAAKNRKLLPIYLGISGINLVNLYHLWFVPRIAGIERIFTSLNGLLPRVLGLTSFILYLKTYSVYWRKGR